MTYRRACRAGLGDLRSLAASLRYRLVESGRELHEQGHRLLRLLRFRMATSTSPMAGVERTDRMISSGGCDGASSCLLTCEERWFYRRGYTKRSRRMFLYALPTFTYTVCIAKPLLRVPVCIYYRRHRIDCALSLHPRGHGRATRLDAYREPKPTRPTRT